MPPRTRVFPLSRPLLLDAAAVCACDPATLENGVPQALADRISGNLVGVWLLVAEHLRLGTWDLLWGWSRREPRGGPVRQ